MKPTVALVTSLPTTPAAVGAGLAVLRRHRSSLATLAFLSLICVLSYRASTRLNVPGNPTGEAWALQDFRDAIYYPTVAFLQGDNPYAATSYTRRYPVGQTFPPYAPHTLLLHLPFGLLPFELAELLYFVVTIGLTLVLARIALAACGVEADAASVLALAAVILATRQGHQNLLLGQCALPVVIGAYLALLQARQRPWLGGVGLALSALKPTFGVPLALLMLCRREVKAVAVGLALAGSLSGGAVAVLVRAVGGVAPFLRSLSSSYAAFEGESTSRAASTWGRIDAAYLLSHLTGNEIGTGATAALGVAILALGGFALWRLSERSDGAGAENTKHLSIGLACLTVLTCTYHQAYDLLLLTLPVTALATSAPRRSWAGHAAMRRLLLGLLLFPAANYLATRTVIGAFALSGPSWLVVTSLNSGALLAAFLLCALLAFQRPGGRQAVSST